VRAFARSDTAIKRDVQHEVMLQCLWMSPDEVDVEVRGDEVTLRGRVDTEFLADVLPQEVRRVPGVVGVPLGANYARALARSPTGRQYDKPMSEIVVGVDGSESALDTLGRSQKPS
jgi:BON domain